LDAVLVLQKLRQVKSPWKFHTLLKAFLKGENERNPNPKHGIPVRDYNTFSL
jgi:hypothetical protein